MRREIVSIENPYEDSEDDAPLVSFDANTLCFHRQARSQAVGPSGAILKRHSGKEVRSLALRGDHLGARLIPEYVIEKIVGES